MTTHPELASISGTLWRGGTSKGLFVDESVLPADPDRRDALILEVFGSPDPLQLNGIGGGKSHTSKLVIVDRDDEYDLRYTFAQVSVEEPEVDWSKNSGNVASAVGAHAIHSGLIDATSPAANLVIRNTNTGSILDQRVPVVEGAPAVLGEYAIDGVPGTGAKIATTYRDPGGAVTGRLLPTGSAVDVIDTAGDLPVSVVDVGSLLAFVRADDLGLTGTELPADLADRSELLERLERARAAIRNRLDLTTAKRSNPSIGIVSPAQTYDGSVDRTVRADAIDLTARFVSLQPHHAISMTGAICLATASRLDGTIPAAVAREPTGGETTIGHPKGTVTVAVDVEAADPPMVRTATYFRTACPLASGDIYYRRLGQLSELSEPSGTGI